MASIYYAKLNVNSVINEVNKGKTTINEHLLRLFKAMEDETEYIDTISWGPKNNPQTKTEKYSFSELDKVNESSDMYIYGKINRIHPKSTEEFDEVSRTSRELFLANNSTSIRFYFDFRTEIITFCARQSFGEKQFLRGFNGIINQYFEDLDFSVFLKSDPFTIEENLNKAHKIYYIKTILVQPNANEEDMKSLYDTDVQKSTAANIHRKTTIFESSKKNRGINMNSDIIKESLELSQAYKKIEKGYGRLEFEAVTEDGVEYQYSSDENSAYKTIIHDDLKDSRHIFIEESKVGITKLVVKEMTKS